MVDRLDHPEVDSQLPEVGESAGGISVSEVPESVEDNNQAARACDFNQPGSIGKDRMQALEEVYRHFVRIFGHSLSELLRTEVEVRTASIEQLTYDEFVNSLPNPTCFNLLLVSPADGQICLEISPLIVYPIVDRLLGGSDAGLYIPQRPLTAIEWRLIGRVTDKVIAGLNRVWSDVEDMGIELAETESNPYLLPVLAPTDSVVVAVIELKMGSRSGTMNICFPSYIIERLTDRLAEQAGQGAARPAQRDVDICAYLAQTAITIEELLRLQPGDVIRTDQPGDGELILNLADGGKFAGESCQHEGSRAVRIISRIEQNE